MTCMQCNPTSTYYLINNTYALPYSASAWVAAGSPLPSFSTDQCCSTVVNGCGVPFTSTQITSSGVSSPVTSALSGQPAVLFSTLSSLNTISGLLQVRRLSHFRVRFDALLDV